MRNSDLTFKRKDNLKLYPIHRMLAADYLFFYAIKVLFLTQVKELSVSDIVIGTACYGIFSVLAQIPSTILVDKYGEKKGIIIGDSLLVITLLITLICDNLFLLIIRSVTDALAFGIKHIAEGGMLNKSIPETEKKNRIFARIDGKGLGDYYYLAAISAVIAGALFTINGYIPMFLSLLSTGIALRLAFLFEDIEQKETKAEKKHKEEKITERYKDYLADLKLAFGFIFTSKRLKALMLFSGVMYGLIHVMSTYEIGLLEELQVSALAVGIISAIMQIISGMAAKKQQKFHNKYRNKSLTIIGLTYTTAILLAGIFALTMLPYYLVVGIIVLSYAVRNIGHGFYYVLIKKIFS